MTVAELIEKLQKCDPAKRVFPNAEDEVYLPGQWPEFDTVEDGADAVYLDWGQS